MIKIKYLILLISAIFLVLPSLAIDPQNPAIGARPIALGRAFAGLADDASAIYVNPAGLASLKSIKLLNLYATPFPNNNLIVLSAGLPDFFGLSAGFGYMNNSTSGLIMSLPDTVEVTYTEQQFLISLAGWSAENISSAVTFNILTKGFSYDSPLLVGNRGFGFDMDVALQYKPTDKIGIGLVMDDILPAFLGGKFYYDSGAWEDLPSNLRLGGAFQFSPKMTFLLDFDKAFTRSLPLLAHSGVEYKPNEALQLRAGLDQTPTAQNNATAVFTHFTFGVGFKVRGIAFDYAFYKRGDPSGKVTNYFSLGYLGEPEELIAAVTPEVEKVVPLSELMPPRVAIQHFTDIPDSYSGRDAIESMATVGIMPGFADGSYHPDQPITRQELENILSAVKHVNPEIKEDSDALITRAEAIKEIAILDRIVIDNKVQSIAFRDVGADNPFAPYIAAALREGVLTASDYFRPDEKMTRAELAQALANSSLGRAILKRLR